MKAMVLTRKDRVRRLGGAPSDGDKAVKLHLRAAGEQFKDAIQCSNYSYIILHLQTKDNIADAISRRELRLEDGAYVVQSWWSPFQELPFKDKSTWSLTLEPLACIIISCQDGLKDPLIALFKFRRCTLLPRLYAWTLASPSSAAGTSETPLVFTYYVAIPVPEAGIKADGDGCIDLSSQDTRPLLACLARNFSAAGRENPFIMEVQPDPVFPLCSSSATAMGVGFFAYKSEDLVLLEMSAPQLLQKKAPIEHPLGCFWLLPACVAWEKIQSGEMLLRKAAFSMTQTPTQDAAPMSKFIQEAQAVHLQSRKRKLEDHIEELKLELGVNQQDLTKVQRQLASLFESQSS